MYDRIFPQVWMHLPRVQRSHLAIVFNLPRTGITEIHNEDVVSDGYTQEDLLHITKEKMEAYVGSEETFGRLWELTVAKCHYELNPPIGTIKGSGVETAGDIIDVNVASPETSQNISEEALDTITKATRIHELSDEEMAITATNPPKHAKKAKSK